MAPCSTESLKEGPVDYGMTCLWLLNVPFVIVAKRKRQIISSPEISDYGSFMITNAKRESYIK
jgi:restriction endonuclease Mrr